MNINPIEQAKGQLIQKAKPLWKKNGKFITLFKYDLLDNLETGNIIDYLEIFDPDFDLMVFIFDHIIVPGYSND